MSLFRQGPKGGGRNNSLTFTIGALGGLALGFLLSRATGLPRWVGGELRSRAGSAVRRLRPARLQRLLPEQEELDRLETTVLDAFLADPILGERPIDIGAISAGIVELSGSVRQAEEVQRAVGLASGVAGVRTVVNRLDIGEPGSTGSARLLDEDDLRSTFGHLEARVGGMGRRRQSPATDPDRPDDSQKIGERALADTDREQWEEEDLTSEHLRMAARAGDAPPPEVDFREEELDHQDPHDQHAGRTLDHPPERLRSSSRVGEGIEPATGLRLEKELEGEPRRRSGADREEGSEGG